MLTSIAIGRWNRNDQLDTIQFVIPDAGPRVAGVRGKAEYLAYSFGAGRGVVLPGPFSNV
jgi:hypothetical protein